MNGWQWIFLLEGLPMIRLTIIICLFLNNILDTMQCKNSENSEKNFKLVYLKLKGCVLMKKSFKQIFFELCAGIINRDIARDFLGETYFMFLLIGKSINVH